MMFRSFAVRRYRVSPIRAAARSLRAKHTRKCRERTLQRREREGACHTPLVTRSVYRARVLLAVACRASPLTLRRCGLFGVKRFVYTSGDVVRRAFRPPLMIGAFESDVEV